MNKIAFIFPGQGSQYVGMAQELCNIYPEAKKIMLMADEELGFKLSNIILNGPEEKLKLTVNTQPALLTVSYICYQLLKTRGISPDYAAGHSLGEYSALVAAESIDFAEALQLVTKRGKLMEEAIPSGKGAMAAVLGLDAKQVEEICKNIDGLVETVNYNCPGQVVIAGEKDIVEKASKIATEAGAKKVVLLNVSGPFHSSLMKTAGEKFATELDNVDIKPPIYPIVANINADLISRPEEIKECLKGQISSPVLWEMSMHKLLELGVNTFVEVGPSKVLSSLMKKINKKVNILNVEDCTTLDNTLRVLEEGEQAC